MATITVGPIVGKVHADRARVLVEVDEDGKYVATLTAPNGQSRQATRTLARNRPGVFTFTGLQADTTYAFTIAGCASPVESRFKTFPANATALNVAAVSCNFPPKKGNTDLWRDMRDRYVRPLGGDGTLHLLLHLGDQVYQDETFQEALELLGDKNKGTAAQERKILEMFRRTYRRNWVGHQPTREVLACVSNLMIWDDHEITDDWGSLPEHQDATTPEYYVGKLAHRVYREYQRQLWDDFDPDVYPTDPLEHHFHQWGPIGVLFVDQRGGRSFARDTARPYLSTKQWEQISTALSPGGDFDACRALLVVTSVPLAYLGDAITDLGSAVPLANDLIDHWAWGPHRKEQIEMVRLLREWKDRVPDARELLVLGGDVHVGGHTEIRHGDRVAFRQLIAGPMTNKPPNLILYLGLRALLEMEDGLGTTYRFEHERFTRARNYGVVMMRVPSTGVPRVDGSLVEAT